jgi:hypothetical protein
MTAKLSPLFSTLLGLPVSQNHPSKPERVWTSPIYPAIGGARSDFWWE